MPTLMALTRINFNKGLLMTAKTPVSIDQLQQRIDKLEAQQISLIEALKILLPLTLAIPATTSNSAQALKQLKLALTQAEEVSPRSEDFWYLASAMSLTLSSKALEQHSTDPEVVATFQGLRAHRKH